MDGRERRLAHARTRVRGRVHRGAGYVVSESLLQGVLGLTVNETAG